MTDKSLVEPDCFSFRKLGDCTWPEFAREMTDTWGKQAEFARFTVVHPESPMPPYPYGWYFEGWSKHPKGREAAFNYPLEGVTQ